MKQFSFVIVFLICCVVSSEAYAQNGLFGRLFRSHQATTNYYTPTYQQSYPSLRQTYQPAFQSSYRSTSSARFPTPITGYGSNLHRNYMIRRAQQRSATTGIQPRNTGNIYWGR